MSEDTLSENTLPDSTLPDQNAEQRGSSDAPFEDLGPQADTGTDQEEPNDLGSASLFSNTDVGITDETSAFEANAITFQLTWRGSPNYWAGRGGNKPVAICDHIMESSIESADSWFHQTYNEDQRASTHFGVARDGRVWQWVRVENSAWGNGIPNRSDNNLGWLKDAVQSRVNPNLLTISIEHEGIHGVALTETQYQATLWLHKSLIQNYSIEPNREHIIGHYQIDSVSRANCPGSAFPWTRLMNDLATTPPGPALPKAPLITTPPPGVINGVFGPGTVNTNNAYVRSYPGFGSGVLVLRKLPAGTLLNFVAYTDQGAAYKNNPRWYLINGLDGGGWIHALMIS